MWAAAEGHLEVVKALLAAGADPNLTRSGAACSIRASSYLSGTILDTGSSFGSLHATKVPKATCAPRSKRAKYKTSYCGKAGGDS
jgi:ankyrin repeat protein